MRRWIGNVGRTRVAAALVAGVLASSALAVPVTTVSVYDAGGGNIESSATAAPDDLATFAAAVLAASLTGNGGIIDFEVGANTTGITIEASYASGAKTLNIGSTETFSMQNFTAATPISGTRGLLIPSADDSNDNSQLNFNSIIGGDANERVTQIGFTILSRDTSVTYTQEIPVTVTLSDGSIIVTSSVINDSNGGDDTFFGFTAPLGLHIASVAFNPPLDAQDSRVILDDLGFITSVVPEPSLVGLLGIGLLAMRRRR